MNEARKLYRSENNRMVAGVCGGLGEFFGIDPTIVRLVFVATTFFVGVGPLLYLVLWIVVPRRSRLDASPGESARDAVDEVREQARRGAQEARTAYERWRAGSAGGEPPAAGTTPPPGEPGPWSAPPTTSPPEQPAPDQPPPPVSDEEPPDPSPPGPEPRG